jgi:ABC-type sugar transport system ATPase subunit
VQLSIARNLFLGREPIKGPRFLNRMDGKLMDEVAGDLLREVGIGKTIPASTPIASLSGGERQAVAIARAMHFDSDLIVLDEPTNNLGVAETHGVLRFVRNARDSGHSCIFIAHNIHHVFQVVDRIVVMRRGKIVDDNIDPKQTSVAEVEDVITDEVGALIALGPLKAWTAPTSRAGWRLPVWRANAAPCLSQLHNGPIVMRGLGGVRAGRDAWGSQYVGHGGRLQSSGGAGGSNPQFRPRPDDLQGGRPRR